MRPYRLHERHKRLDAGTALFAVGVLLITITVTVHLVGDIANALAGWLA